MDEQIRKEILDFIWSERLLDEAELQSTPDAEDCSIRIVNKKGDIMDVKLALEAGEMHLLAPKKSLFVFVKDEAGKWKPKYFEKLNALGCSEERFMF